jgi:Protein prenyltransferase alpha subunit repeat
MLGTVRPPHPVRLLIHDCLFALVIAWDYRRYVLESMPVRRPEKTELAYTTKKIEANFSNFSAWHQRTKVLSSLWASGEVDRTSSLQRGAGGLPLQNLLLTASGIRV